MCDITVSSITLFYDLGLTNPQCNYLSQLLYKSNGTEDKFPLRMCEIETWTNLSRSQVNKFNKTLASMNLISVEKIGRMNHYKVHVGHILSLFPHARCLSQIRARYVANTSQSAPIMPENTLQFKDLTPYKNNNKEKEQEHETPLSFSSFDTSSLTLQPIAASIEEPAKQPEIFCAKTEEILSSIDVSLFPELFTSPQTKKLIEAVEKGATRKLLQESVYTYRAGAIKVKHGAEVSFIAGIACNTLKQANNLGIFTAAHKPFEKQLPTPTSSKSKEEKFAMLESLKNLITPMRSRA